MHRPFRKIAICAPATPLRREQADAVAAIAARDFPEVTLTFHDQCFLEEGHFAGSDAVRLAALLECANDTAFDAVWFAKGGYGSNRIVEGFMGRIGDAARTKGFLGYSDLGTLLGALYRAGVGQPVHAPMPVDIRREGGEQAIRRVLAYMGGDDGGLEPEIGGTPTVAFNLMTLAMLVGTRFMPNLDGHELLVEEVGEYEYAVDRLFFHAMENLRGIASLRLGEITAIPENDRPFGTDVEHIARDWCERYGILYRGRAAIGHTADNHIVPFGLEANRARG